VHENREFGSFAERRERSDWSSFVVLDEVGDGAGGKHEDEAVDRWRWGGVAQIVGTTRNVVLIRLFAIVVGAGTKDLKVILFALFHCHILNFLLQIHQQILSSSRALLATWQWSEWWLVNSRVGGGASRRDGRRWAYPPNFCQKQVFPELTQKL